jgi:anti-anti-sigma factor
MEAMQKSRDVRDFKVTTSRVEPTGTVRVSVEGEFDISTAEQLAEPINQVTRAGEPLLVDLSACSFIDPAGLRVVLHTHSALAEHGKPMAVVVGEGQVARFFSVVAVDRSVRVFTDVGEAEEFLGQS